MRRCELHSGELIKRIHDQMEKVANNMLQSLDMTFSQMKMLIALHESADESATLKELERYFGVAQATAAGIAVRLEKKHLITSYIDPDDRRIKHVKLSDEGRNLCEQLHSMMIANEDKLVAPLSEDEKVELRRLLQKVYDGSR